MLSTSARGVRATGAPRAAWGPPWLPLAAVISAAWLISIWAEKAGLADHLHHHTLFHSAQPLWLSSLQILLAWQVMTSAMMLPCALPAVMATARERGAGGATGFLLAYFAIWTGFAGCVFWGDMLLHYLVHAWSWLGAHDRLVPAATLALAAAYELTGTKRAHLQACGGAARPRRGLEAGWAYGFSCLGSSWALMLVMFGAGFAHLAWMAGLTLVMLLERARPGDRWTLSAVGCGLGLLAVLTRTLNGVL
jgi:predicted metal-binding membrane protein